jgi:hypothetical protein
MNRSSSPSLLHLFAMIDESERANHPVPPMNIGTDGWEIPYVECIAWAPGSLGMESIPEGSRFVVWWTLPTLREIGNRLIYVLLLSLHFFN